MTKQVVKTFELKSETHTCLALKVLALSSRTDKGRRSILRADGMEKMLEAFGPFVGSKEHCLNLLEAVYNLLELRLNRPILDNIIFLGLAQSISRAGKPSGARSRHPEP